MVRALLLGSAITLALASGASAVDLYAPTTPQPIYEAGGFSWEGAYAGGFVGGQFDEDGTNTVLGGLVGYNFIVADPVLLGLEFQGSYDLRDNFHSTKLMFNGRAGVVVTDSVLVYALAGVGLLATSYPDQGNAHQFGGGVELAVTDSVSVRGEVARIGTFDDVLGAPDATRATIGAAFHF